MTSRALRVVVALALPMLLAACETTEPSGDIRQDRIWTNYQLEYDGSRNVTIAKAVFRVRDADGATLDLTEGSEVRFQGQLLSRHRELGATWYERTISGATNGGRFRWVDADGEVYENDVAMRVAEFPATSPTLDNDRDYTLAWVGPALVAGEEMTLTLSRAGTIGSSASGLQNVAGSTSVTVLASRFQDFQPGAATGELLRSQWLQPVDRTSVGGRIEVRWKASPVGITIVD